MTESVYIKDVAPIIQKMSRFLAFVHYQDRQLGLSPGDLISFSDSNGFLGMEEGYKTGIVESVREKLRFKEWSEKWIGTGKIAERAAVAIGSASNLVNFNQQLNFKNRLNPSHELYRPDAELALYEIYRGSDEKKAFELAVDVFGAKYDTIAFLFFVKDCERFLPISPGNFDKSFKQLGIDFKTSHKCSWDNYFDFISVISEIQALMNEILPLKSQARLLDAHSFVWVLHEEKFINWIPSEEDTEAIEDNTESSVQQIVSGKAKKKLHFIHTYSRNAEVVKVAKARANGICQLCGHPAPFQDSKGKPYLEVHHIVWLSRGGEDSTENVAALCPNCHTKMHVVDDPLDVKVLQMSLMNN